jgi:cytochrome c5
MRSFAWILASWISAALFAQTPPAPPRLPELPPPTRIKRSTNLPFASRPAQSVARVTPGTLPAPVAPATPQIQYPQALSWDKMVAELNATNGQQSIDFKFGLTNVWTNAVTVSGTHTSCGCTVARLPQTPWVLQPGDHGEIAGSVNLFGKFGTVAKTVTVSSDVGAVNLLVRVVIPVPDPNQMREADRQRNLSIAAADRQAVFRGDCATCHVTPTLGKKGKELYTAACGICHEGEHRASMVPSLKELKHPTDYDYWLTWIKHGKPNTLMPAFDLKEGGILDPAQMESLAEYLDSAAFNPRPLQVSLPLDGAAATK